MKSIVEKASSVAKAVEKAWNSANNPKEFHIKVLEKPEYNFIGFTTKPATISLFFDERTQRERPPSRHSRQGTTEVQSTSRRDSSKRRDSRRDSRDHHSSRPEKHSFEKTSKTQDSPRHEAWSEEMVQFVEQWIKQSFNALDLTEHAFTTERPSGSSLRIVFNASIYEDGKNERYFFSGIAQLVMEALRNKFKKRFRNLKVCLSTPSNTHKQ